MIAKQELEQIVARAIAGAQVSARDLTGGADHYELTIIAAAFRGRSTLERHRMVYDALVEPLRGPLHAVVLKTIAPDEK